jgi:hypothetical protein
MPGLFLFFKKVPTTVDPALRYFWETDETKHSGDGRGASCFSFTFAAVYKWTDERSLSLALTMSLCSQHTCATLLNSRYLEVDGRVANDRSGFLLIGSSGARQWSGHGVASTTIHLRWNATRLDLARMMINCLERGNIYPTASSANVATNRKKYFFSRRYLITERKKEAQ